VQIVGEFRYLILEFLGVNFAIGLSWPLVAGDCSNLAFEEEGMEPSLDGEDNLLSRPYQDGVICTRVAGAGIKTNVFKEFLLFVRACIIPNRQSHRTAER